MPHSDELLHLEGAGVDVFKRLYERYKIIVGNRSPNGGGPADVGGGRAYLSTTIVPVDDVSKLLAIPQIRNLSQVALSGTGPISFGTVPTSERWEIKVVDLNTDSGDATFENLRLNDGQSEIRYFSQSPATSLRTTFTGTIWAGPGWSIVVDIGTNTSTSNITALFLVRRELVG